MTDLEHLLTRFILSSESKIQLDFYCRNQIILQIFKRDDVKNWDYGIEKQIQDDLIIELTFNKNKIDNKNNKQRFTKSHLMNNFIKIDSVKEDSYWIGIQKNTSISTIKQEIYEIINTIYDLHNESIEFTLNAY